VSRIVEPVLIFGSLAVAFNSIGFLGLAIFLGTFSKYKGTNII
jgi:hypothetical protein